MNRFSWAALRCIKCCNVSSVPNGLAVLAGFACINIAFASDLDFDRDVRPILESHCVSCHRTDKAEGGLDLSSKVAAMTSGDNAPSIVPNEPSESPIYRLLTLPGDDELRMPPIDTGDSLSDQEMNVIKEWIKLGAIWPDEIKLVAKGRSSKSTDNPDNRALVARIHQRILNKAALNGQPKLEDYESVVAKASAKFSMVAIPGGTFRMGSPEGESNRNDDEGPTVQIPINPFWIGKYEVTWDEYEPFQLTQVGRNKDGSLQVRSKSEEPVDAVSQPTAPYQPMDFGMGRKGFPAVCMTHHAANKYCQWLSAQTDEFYRLPTEAEWEYAARCNTETAYFWGDDPSKLAEHAWFYDNSEQFQYSRVGKKKANPWGLHDMYGNVCEWCLDQYTSDAYGVRDRNLKQGIQVGPWVKSKTAYPHVARGGSYDDDAKDCRSAARKASDPTWKQQDPQLPKSIWYLTDAPWLGFRIVRPLAIPSVDEIYDSWNNGVEYE